MHVGTVVWHKVSMHRLKSYLHICVLCTIYLSSVLPLIDALLAVKMPKPTACSDDVAELERVEGTSYSNPSKRRLSGSLLNW